MGINGRIRLEKVNHLQRRLVHESLLIYFPILVVQEGAVQPTWFYR